VSLWISAADEYPEEHARDVGVENGCALTEGEAQDRPGSVFADTLEGPQRRFVARQLAPVAFNGLARNRVQAPRTDVVSERPPGGRNVGFGRGRERLQRRILRQPFVILRKDTVHLSLLEHHLGDEDTVGIASQPPRQVAPVAPVPFEKAPPEHPARGRPGQRRQLLPRGLWLERPSARVFPCTPVFFCGHNQNVKIYTRTGDAGDTGLFDGTRVLKSDARVGSCGDVDELNAWLGLVRTEAALGASDSQLIEMVEQIQRDLFGLGARLADPAKKIAERVTKAAVTDEDISRLEGWIDLLEAELPPLRRFILAGGSRTGAALHVARTICRRAERSIVGLGVDAIEPALLRYMNRLSDLLFVMARAANRRAGAAETEW
jgi:cob(I)alamin adenosyltransferase